MIYRPVLVLIFLFAGTTGVRAQEPWQPDHKEMLERYRHAKAMEEATRNTVFRAGVQPHWQADGSSFWYRNVLKDSVLEYIYVQPFAKKKQAAFDHMKLAEALGRVTGRTLDGRRLRISRMELGKSSVALEIDSACYRCDLGKYTCAVADSFPGRRYPRGNFRRSRWQGFSTDRISPDKKWTAFIRDGNVFIRPAGSDASDGEHAVIASAPDNNSATNTAAVQYTHNGTKEKPYGALAWSPDSRYVVGYHINPVEDSSVFYILTSASGTRGQLRSHPYKQPGDPFTTYEMHIFPVGATGAVKVNTEIIDFFDAPRLHWRAGDSRYFTYEKVDRGHQRFRIIEVDTETATSKTLLDERTETFIYESRIFTEYLPETNEILWSSEKDGWRHLYLVDGITGKVKNPVTSGPWVVRQIDSVDKKKREVWFRASGMHAGEDPYFVHYYRIGLDGKGLVELTPAKGHHTVTFSPDKEYYTDTYSQVDIPPVTALHRTQDGKKIMELEKADASAFFATGMRPVESFVAKGRDGKTDIWGVVCRPSDFDPAKKYPVIENIYAGPQDAFVPKSFMGSFSEMQSMAELGFIVVQIDGMGTANRSKAFHDVCWKNLADAGFPDRILWIKALAAKYPYIDTARVGLYGTSAGGQNALGGLLFHPDFYKAAVASCGCHDNRVDKQWWNEQWMGYPVGRHYEEQSNVTNAGKLRGHLLLIVGESDTNVPPESTYRVINALIKAEKSFDFLPVPGMGHSDGGPYGRIKKRDFFVKHLLGVDPPQRNAGEL
ncbi:S9 family peptidase [Chitinophaga cymbidii]|nr:S9 family peptidase [Chitinophaga cymbidii]